MSCSYVTSDILEGFFSFLGSSSSHFLSLVFRLWFMLSAGVRPRGPPGTPGTETRIRVSDIFLVPTHFQTSVSIPPCLWYALKTLAASFKSTVKQSSYCWPAAFDFSLFLTLSCYNSSIILEYHLYFTFLRLVWKALKKKNIIKNDSTVYLCFDMRLPVIALSVLRLYLTNCNCMARFQFSGFSLCFVDNILL